MLGTWCGMIQVYQARMRNGFFLFAKERQRDREPREQERDGKVTCNLISLLLKIIWLRQKNVSLARLFVCVSEELRKNETRTVHVHLIPFVHDDISTRVLSCKVGLKPKEDYPIACLWRTNVQLHNETRSHGLVKMSWDVQLCGRVGLDWVVSWLMSSFSLIIF